MSPTHEQDRPFDRRLLNGFRFACLPACGLCCYTTPRTTSAELIQIEALRPGVPTLALADGGRAIASHPAGGACRMLSEARTCTVYSARPGPCAMFPITVHGGADRWQASLVLSCPGVALDVLEGWDRSRDSPAPVGLRGEIGAAMARTRLPFASAALVADLDRRRQIEGARRTRESDLDWERVRAEVREDIPAIEPDDLPGERAPRAEDGLEYLPLAWAAPGRIVGLAESARGVRTLELGPTGGAREIDGPIKPPRRIPSISPRARALLDGYLRYWLERDALFDYLLMEREQSDRPPEGLGDRVRRELRFIGATAISRAFVRARGAEGATSLDVEEMAWGIRATDMDLLDRDGLGVRL